MAVKIKRTAISSLSITPLIDVVFLLLIFFLVSSRFSEEERELDLNLPSISEALPATDQPAEIVINIDDQGRYFVEGEFREPAAIEQILRTAKRDNPLTQTVVIRGDKTAGWGLVAAAMAMCRKVGISDFSATSNGD